MKTIFIVLLVASEVFAQTNQLSATSVIAIDSLPASATTDELLKAFQSTVSLYRKFKVAEKMVARGDRSVIPALAPMLQSTNPADRCNAGFVLASFGNDQGFDLLLREMGDRSPLMIFTAPDGTGGRNVRHELRYHVSILLAFLKDRRALPVLIQSLEDDVGYGAAYALAMIGDPAAIPALRDRLSSSNEFDRLSFAYALGRLGDPKGTETMIEFLSIPDWGDQVRALEALGEFGDERALGPVSAALRDPHANVRIAAAQALGAIGGAAEISALEPLFSDSTTRPWYRPITVGNAASQAVAQIRSRITPTGGTTQ